MAGSLSQSLNQPRTENNPRQSRRRLRKGRNSRWGWSFRMGDERVDELRIDHRSGRID